MIERTYMQWIGTSYFATVDDFLVDVSERGVCRKLPNQNVAIEVAKPGTLIFLAHDQGRARECLACAELVSCPTCGGDGVLPSDSTQCPRCRGLGAFERGTGGSALVDGERWTYIRLLRLRKNRAHEFWKTEHEIEQVEYCPACGGRGRLPQGIVFGFYAPEHVIWVRQGRSGKNAPTRLEGARIEVFGKSRYQGRNLTRGSYYAIVRPKRNDQPTPADFAGAVSALLGPGVEYFHGRFGRLAEPIPYTGKHFRGLKRWEVPAHIPDEPERGLLEGVA